jgi:hypothetical protein
MTKMIWRNRIHVGLQRQFYVGRFWTKRSVVFIFVKRKKINSCVHIQEKSISCVNLKTKFMKFSGDTFMNSSSNSNNGSHIHESKILRFPNSWTKYYHSRIHEDKILWFLHSRTKTIIVVAFMRKKFFCIAFLNCKNNTADEPKEKVKLSLQQGVEAHRVVRRRGSHIF